MRKSRRQATTIVVKTSTHVRISALRQRLILMPSRAVGELNRRNVYNSFARFFGQHMYKTEKILTGIAKSHSASDAAFVITCAATHKVGYKTLILIPDIDDAIEFFVVCLNRKIIEQGNPIFL